MPTAKVKKDSAKQQAVRKRAHLIIVACTTVSILVLIDIFTPVWGGQIKYYSTWFNCGQQPVMAYGLPGGGVNFYINTPPISPLRSNHEKYFCTPKDAEKAGYSNSRDQYTYPHLTQEEQQYLFDHGPVGR